MKGVCGPRVEYVLQTSHESVAILAGIFPFFVTCLSIKGLVCRTVWRLNLLILSLFLEYPMKIKYFGLTESKLFHFHRIIKIGVGRGFERTP